jgi:hypothetical protein
MNTFLMRGARVLAAQAALLLCVTTAEAHKTSPRPDVIADWNATAVSVIVSKGAQGPVYLALMQAAVFDAVNAIDGRYQTYAVKPTSATRGASQEAAAAAAAYGVLLGVWPDQRTVLDTALAASLAAIPDGPAESKGVTVGTEVAAAWLAKRATDGREAPVPYVFDPTLGKYQRTPPAFPNPLTPWVAKMTPFALTSASQFRAYGPPDLTSERYAKDLNATKTLGSATSTERLPEETEIARFHTENPSSFWARNLRNLVSTQRMDTAERARTYAVLFVSFGDAIISCWDSKYYFNSWRPVTAIPLADQDGNPGTEADTAWTPLAVTPPHPEYPAAHGCAAGAISEVLRRTAGTRWITFTFDSTIPGTIPHVYYSTDDLVDEIERARVFGGMHFPTSVAHGVGMGKKVGNWVMDHYFKPVKKGH